jgi:hypothetical protein
MLPRMRFAPAIVAFLLLVGCNSDRAPQSSPAAPQAPTSETPTKPHSAPGESGGPASGAGVPVDGVPGDAETAKNTPRPPLPWAQPALIDVPKDAVGSVSSLAALSSSSKDAQALEDQIARALDGQTALAELHRALVAFAPPHGSVSYQAVGLVPTKEDVEARKKAVEDARKAVEDASKTVQDQTLSGPQLEQLNKQRQEELEQRQKELEVMVRRREVVASWRKTKGEWQSWADAVAGQADEKLSESQERFKALFESSRTLGTNKAEPTLDSKAGLVLLALLGEDWHGRCGTAKEIDEWLSGMRKRGEVLELGRDDPFTQAWQKFNELVVATKDRDPTRWYRSVRAKEDLERAARGFVSDDEAGTRARFLATVMAVALSGPGDLSGPWLKGVLNARRRDKSDGFVDSVASRLAEVTRQAPSSAEPAYSKSLTWVAVTLEVVDPLQPTEVVDPLQPGGGAARPATSLIHAAPKVAARAVTDHYERWALAWALALGNQSDLAQKSLGSLVDACKKEEIKKALGQEHEERLERLSSWAQAESPPGWSMVKSQVLPDTIELVAAVVELNRSLKLLRLLGGWRFDGENRQPVSFRDDAAGVELAGVLAADAGQPLKLLLATTGRAGGGGAVRLARVELVLQMAAAHVEALERSQNGARVTLAIGLADGGRAKRETGGLSLGELVRLDPAFAKEWKNVAGGSTLNCSPADIHQVKLDEVRFAAWNPAISTDANADSRINPPGGTNTSTPRGAVLALVNLNGPTWFEPFALRCVDGPAPSGVRPEQDAYFYDALSRAGHKYAVKRVLDLKPLDLPEGLKLENVGENVESVPGAVPTYRRKHKLTCPAGLVGPEDVTSTYRFAGSQPTLLSSLTVRRRLEAEDPLPASLTKGLDESIIKGMYQWTFDASEAGGGSTSASAEWHVEAQVDGKARQLQAPTLYGEVKKGIVDVEWSRLELVRDDPSGTPGEGLPSLLAVPTDASRLVNLVPAWRLDHNVYLEAGSPAKRSLGGPLASGPDLVFERAAQTRSDVDRSGLDLDLSLGLPLTGVAGVEKNATALLRANPELTLLLLERDGGRLIICRRALLIVAPALESLGSRPGGGKTIELSLEDIVLRLVEDKSVNGKEVRLKAQIVTAKPTKRQATFVREFEPGLGLMLTVESELELSCSSSRSALTLKSVKAKLRDVEQGAAKLLAETSSTLDNSLDFSEAELEQVRRETVRSALTQPKEGRVSLQLQGDGVVAGKAEIVLANQVSLNASIQFTDDLRGITLNQVTFSRQSSVTREEEENLALFVLARVGIMPDLVLANGLSLRGADLPKGSLSKLTECWGKRLSFKLGQSSNLIHVTLRLDGGVEGESEGDGRAVLTLGLDGATVGVQLQGFLSNLVPTWKDRLPTWKEPPSGDSATLLVDTKRRLASGLDNLRATAALGVEVKDEKDEGKVREPQDKPQDKKLLVACGDAVQITRATPLRLLVPLGAEIWLGVPLAYKEEESRWKFILDGARVLRPRGRNAPNAWENLLAVPSRLRDLARPLPLAPDHRPVGLFESIDIEVKPLEGKFGLSVAGKEVILDGARVENNDELLWALAAAAVGSPSLNTKEAHGIPFTVRRVDQSWTLELNLGSSGLTLGNSGPNSGGGSLISLKVEPKDGVWRWGEPSLRQPVSCDALPGYEGTVVLLEDRLNAGLRIELAPPLSIRKKFVEELQVPPEELTVRVLWSPRGVTLNGEPVSLLDRAAFDRVQKRLAEYAVASLERLVPPETKRMLGLDLLADTPKDGELAAILVSERAMNAKFRVAVRNPSADATNPLISWPEDSARVIRMAAERALKREPSALREVLLPTGQAAAVILRDLGALEHVKVESLSTEQEKFKLSFHVETADLLKNLSDKALPKKLILGSLAPFKGGLKPEPVAREVVAALERELNKQFKPTSEVAGISAELERIKTALNNLKVPELTVGLWDEWTATLGFDEIKDSRLGCHLVFQHPSKGWTFLGGAYLQPLLRDGKVQRLVLALGEASTFQDPGDAVRARIGIKGARLNGFELLLDSFLRKLPGAGSDLIFEVEQAAVHEGVANFAANFQIAKLPGLRGSIGHKMSEAESWIGKDGLFAFALPAAIELAIRADGKPTLEKRSLKGDEGPGKEFLTRMWAAMAVQVDLNDMKLDLPVAGIELSRVRVEGEDRGARIEADLKIVLCKAPRFSLAGTFSLELPSGDVKIKTNPETWTTLTDDFKSITGLGDCQLVRGPFALGDFGLVFAEGGWPIGVSFDASIDLGFLPAPAGGFKLLGDGFRLSKTGLALPEAMDIVATGFTIPLGQFELGNFRGSVTLPKNGQPLQIEAGAELGVTPLAMTRPAFYVRGTVGIEFASAPRIWLNAGLFVAQIQAGKAKVDLDLERQRFTAALEFGVRPAIVLAGDVLIDARAGQIHGRVTAELVGLSALQAELDIRFRPFSIHATGELDLKLSKAWVDIRYSTAPPDYLFAAGTTILLFSADVRADSRRFEAIASLDLLFVELYARCTVPWDRFPSAVSFDFGARSDDPPAPGRSQVGAPVPSDSVTLQDGGSSGGGSGSSGHGGGQQGQTGSSNGDGNGTLAIKIIGQEKLTRPKSPPKVGGGVLPGDVSVATGEGSVGSGDAYTYTLAGRDLRILRVDQAGGVHDVATVVLPPAVANHEKLSEFFHVWCSFSLSGREIVFRALFKRDEKEPGAGEEDGLYTHVERSWSASLDSVRIELEQLPSLSTWTRTVHAAEIQHWTQQRAGRGPDQVEWPSANGLAIDAIVAVRTNLGQAGICWAQGRAVAEFLRARVSKATAKARVVVLFQKSNGTTSGSLQGLLLLLSAGENKGSVVEITLNEAGQRWVVQGEQGNQGEQDHTWWPLYGVPTEPMDLLAIVWRLEFTRGGKDVDPSKLHLGGEKEGEIKLDPCARMELTKGSSRLSLWYWQEFSGTAGGLKGWQLPDGSWKVFDGKSSGAREAQAQRLLHSAGYGLGWYTPDSSRRADTELAWTGGKVALNTRVRRFESDVPEIDLASNISEVAITLPLGSYGAPFTAEDWEQAKFHSSLRSTGDLLVLQRGKLREVFLGLKGQHFPKPREKLRRSCRIVLPEDLPERDEKIISGWVSGLMLIHDEWTKLLEPPESGDVSWQLRVQSVKAEVPAERFLPETLKSILADPEAGSDWPTVKVLRAPHQPDVTFLLGGTPLAILEWSQPFDFVAARGRSAGYRLLSNIQDQGIWVFDRTDSARPSAPRSIVAVRDKSNGQGVVWCESLLGPDEWEIVASWQFGREALRQKLDERVLSAIEPLPLIVVAASSSLFVVSNGNASLYTMIGSSLSAYEGKPFAQLMEGLASNGVGDLAALGDSARALRGPDGLFTNLQATRPLIQLLLNTLEGATPEIRELLLGPFQGK